MSIQPSLAPRPRRVSRAPSRMGDENSTGAITTTGGPRLANKASSTALSTAGGVRLGKAAIGVAAVLGKAGSTTSITGGVGAGPRRALLDTTNAIRNTTSGLERQSKETLVAQKPVRTRASATNLKAVEVQVLPQHPSSSGTGIGLSRLKINHPPPNVPTQRARTQDLKIVSQTIKEQGGRSWNAQEDLQVGDNFEILRDEGQYGLGIKDEEARLYELKSEADERIPLKRAPNEEGDFDAKDSVKVRIVDEEVDFIDEDDWMAVIDEDEESERILEGLRAEFDEKLEYWDTTMVAEYSEEIFEYMADLEVAAMANPRYMDHQTEIEWPMRTTLIDWLLQVHMRYHMLPETLWITVNIIDRFMSNRVVSLEKFQLVGVTAMFVAAKYEEIMAPSVDEFVLMTEQGYGREEILKGERIILQSLEFNISPYCSPYSWVRRISKADDYELRTRTLAKFLMEVTLLDHRFLRAKPSMIAAIGMFLARKMLGGDWNASFIYYSNYTEAQLLIPTGFLVESIAARDFDLTFVYKKYAGKKFLKASYFARNWALANPDSLRI